MSLRKEFEEELYKAMYKDFFGAAKIELDDLNTNEMPKREAKQLADRLMMMIKECSDHVHGGLENEEPIGYFLGAQEWDE